MTSLVMTMLAPAVSTRTVTLAAIVYRPMELAFRRVSVPLFGGAPRYHRGTEVPPKPRTSRDFWGVVYETYIVKIIRVSSFGAAILPQ